MKCKHVFHCVISQAVLFIIFPMSMDYQNNPNTLRKFSELLIRYVVYWYCTTRQQTHVLGAIQVLRNADGGGGVTFSGKKVLPRCVWFNVISVTRGWVRVQFPGKKHYVTLEWPLVM